MNVCALDRMADGSDVTMLVSFIIPFYGSVPLLKRALDGLVAQTDGDFEVVVVDDRSPASAKGLVAQYDGRFRSVLQPENRGPYQGRVRGVEEARGEYVVDVDCDDYVLPELVAELRRAIERNHADIVIYNVEQDADGVITPHWCRYEPGVYSPAEVMERLVAKKLQWNFWAKAIRREVILKTWDVTPGLHATHVLAPDDFCATVPMILQSGKIEVIPYVGHRYWQGGGSICRGISFTKARRAVLDTLVARRLVLDFAERKGCPASIGRQIKFISRMIGSWWVREYVHSVKRRLLPWKAR